MKLADVDLYSPDNYVDHVPHEMFKVLRAEAPVFWNPEPEGPGFWSLTKYKDVVSATHDWRTHSSGKKGVFLFDPAEEDMGATSLILTNMDPPEHTNLRRLVRTGFFPAMMRQIEPHIRDLAREIVDRVADKGECDFVTEIAAELPLQVILEMMGVPVEDRHIIFDLSNRLIGFDDPEYSSSREDQFKAATEIYAYANELAIERKKNPRDDVVSVLMQAEIDGESLSELQFDLFFLLLAVAGNETTRNLISGGMLALIEHPEERAKLVADPSLLPSAVDEMLRWVSPVMQFRRTTTRDTEFRGQKIREGEKVVMWYISANRDEEVFENSDVFDISRSPNNQIAFGGGGPHHCLGMTLAPMEINIMFGELLRRIPDMELTGPVDRLRSNFINGIKRMPVKFTPEKG